MLAALVLLQRSERAAPGMSVINVHKDELLRDCDVPVAVTPHNTAPDFERRGMRALAREGGGGDAAAAASPRATSTSSTPTAFTSSTLRPASGGASPSARSSA